MKYLTLPIALLLVLSLSHTEAQTLKGDRLIGGSGSFSFNGDGMSGMINPNIGWFLKDNFALGASATLYTYNDWDSNSNFQIMLAPFIRYYFNDEGKFRYFGYGKISIGESFATWYEQPRNTFLMQGNVGAGIAHFITDQVALEALVGYSLEKIGTNRDMTSQFYLSFGLQIHLLANK